MPVGPVSSVAGVPLGHPGRCDRAGQVAPGRHRRPFRRHTGRSGGAADPRSARGGQRRAGISHDRRHAGTSPVGRRGPGTPVRRGRSERGGRAAGDRHQGTHRVVADAARARRRGPCCGARAGLSHLRRRRPAGRNPGALRRFADPARSRVAGIGVCELAEQPDRAGARRRSLAQGRRLGQGPRRAGGIRRVLPGPGLGRRAVVGSASRRVRRRPHRPAGGALAVQELLAGRLSGRVRCRRPSGGRRAAGGTQTRRDDGADTGAGGHGRRAR